MTESGSWGEHGVREFSLIQREKYFKASGGMTKRMDSESTYIPMEHSMRESGAKTCSTVWGKRGGRMDQSLRDATERARKMVLESTYGQMVLAMKVNGRIMK